MKLSGFVNRGTMD